MKIRVEPDLSWKHKNELDMKKVRVFAPASIANMGCGFDVIPEFLATGKYRPRPSVRTVANAMDVGAPSNFERLMYLLDNDLGDLKQCIYKL